MVASTAVRSRTGLLEVSCLESWRAWLVDNHRSADSVWLVFTRKGGGGSSPTYVEAVEEALCYGWIDSIVKGLDECRYARLFTPRRPGSAWSALNRRRAEELIAGGRMTPAGMVPVDEARSTGRWTAKPDGPKKEADTVPRELEEALDLAPASRPFFESLPPSCRRNCILWVSAARRPATRARRAGEAAAAFARGERLGLK